MYIDTLLHVFRTAALLMPYFFLATNLLVSLVLALCWEQHYTDLFLVG